ncbi:hypothetical protein [Thermotalea metallivorans]|uniref:Uncharacterized protein n=1 Tax=Thermotalea metallivorans TaxID=520762 RepID=A0A140LBF2_9FIRM|nr:hypothetical protein [Thermotalea metallivorans]KXG77877.1 hypothetical protein AN619_03310 [Thermotalea metallivorans]
MDHQVYELLEKIYRDFHDFKDAMNMKLSMLEKSLQEHREEIENLKDDFHAKVPSIIETIEEMGENLGEELDQLRESLDYGLDGLAYIVNSQIQ